MQFIDKIRNYLRLVRKIKTLDCTYERNQLLFGRILSDHITRHNSINENEFCIFSQFGDDGIIQFLIHNLEIRNKFFVEFGVEDYVESNTRFLMMNNNWSGFIMDGSKSNIQNIISASYYWKYDLTAEHLFVTKENINKALENNCPKEVGLLHIDLDGNDYWIWEEISAISPIIVILEYNSVYGIDRAITVPYEPEFCRTKAHYSNLYWGASLKALHNLSKEKGYVFIGCNSAGNNGYFIRKDKINEKVKEVSLEEGFIVSKYRESRDVNGQKTFITGDKRIEVVRGLEIYDTEKHIIEKL
ncbi:TPA: hypothetical protein HA241_06480 [Candidatus Woesearchaeota archaeon]|nr:hypothetical protein [Candidatus Woesearchaeota archaeon]